MVSILLNMYQAKFVPFESGGHFLVGRLDAMHNEIMGFIHGVDDSFRLGDDDSW